MSQEIGSERRFHIVEKIFANSGCLETPKHAIARSSVSLFSFKDHCLSVHWGETAFLLRAFLTGHAAACFSALPG